MIPVSVRIFGGEWKFKFGGTYIYTYTHEDEKNDITLNPGDISTAILTVGQVWNGIKTIGGYILADHGALEDDTGTISGSERKDRSWYLTVESLNLSHGNYRFTVSESGLAGSEKSVSKISYTVAFMKGFYI